MNLEVKYLGKKKPTCHLDVPLPWQLPGLIFLRHLPFMNLSNITAFKWNRVTCSILIAPWYLILSCRDSNFDPFPYWCLQAIFRLFWSLQAVVSEFLFLGTLVWVSGMKAAPGFFGSFTLESGTWFCSVDSVSTAKVNSWSPTSHGDLLGQLSASHWMSLPQFSIRLWRSDNGFWVLSSFRVLTSSRLKTKVKPRHDNAHLPSQLWGSGGRTTRGSKASLCSLGYRKPNGKTNCARKVAVTLSKSSTQSRLFLSCRGLQYIHATF